MQVELPWKYQTSLTRRWRKKLFCLKATKNGEKRKKNRKTEGEPDVACGSVPYGVSSASGIFQKNDWKFIEWSSLYWSFSGHPHLRVDRGRASPKYRRSVEAPFGSRPMSEDDIKVSIYCATSPWLSRLSNRRQRYLPSRSQSKSGSGRSPCA